MAGDIHCMETICCFQSIQGFCFFDQGEPRNILYFGSLTIRYACSVLMLATLVFIFDRFTSDQTDWPNTELNNHNLAEHSARYNDEWNDHLS